MNPNNCKVFQERPMKLLRLTSCHLINQMYDWIMQIKWMDKNQVTIRNKWTEWHLHNNSFNKDTFLLVLSKQNLQLRPINSSNKIKDLNNTNNLNNSSNLSNQTLTSNLHLISLIKLMTSSLNLANLNYNHNLKHKITQFNNLVHNQHIPKINIHKSKWKDLEHPINKYWQVPVLVKASNWMLVNNLAIPLY